MNTSQRRAAAVRVAGLVLAAGAARAGAADTVIGTNNRVPLWDQHHDYRAQMGNRLTDIRKADDTGWVRYADLAGDPRTFWEKDKPWVRADLAAGSRGAGFTAAHYYQAGPPLSGWAGGVNHCAPTSYGMMHEWMRTTKLDKLQNYGGEQQTIEAYAMAADTNDINYSIRAATSSGTSWVGQVVHAGTYTDDAMNSANAAISAVPAYAKDAGPKVKAFTWGKGAYKSAIKDDGRPMILNYWDVAGNLGHTVVAVGYDDDNVIVKDPWDATQRKKAFNKITDVDARWSVQLGDPVPTGFDSDWGGAGMMTLVKPDYGDCPSIYEPSEPLQARHRDALGLWLGRGVSGEIGLTDAGDDDDGIPNAGDRDAFDDGASFRWNPDGSGFADISVTMRDWTREADPGVDGPDAYGHAAADPNMYLSVWADVNHTGSWATATAVLSNSIVGQITENGSGALSEFLVNGLALPASDDGQPYWVRVRLSRENGLGAYGATEYGEVEDYFVPAPGPASLLGLGLLTAAKRRRSTNARG
ncbi:MAG: hypothetical protein IT436_15030 [Phycisphaerales bacterium]|nr:hypothetical protein [Phycisphaerales bacterium]